METKKNKKYDLEQKRPLFFGIGMIISLAFAITAFEWRTEIEPIVTHEEVIIDFPEFIPPVTFNEPIPPPPPKSILIEEVNDHEGVETLPEIDIQIDEPLPEIILIPITPAPVDEAPWNYAEVMPTYEGGMDKFYQFLGKNIKYPTAARRMGIQGRVFVQFVVEKDGTLKDFHIVRGIGEGCDEEALRVMNLIPTFIPGKQGDVRVPIKMIIPINFTLNN